MSMETLKQRRIGAPVLGTIAVLLLAATSASAHFVWIETQRKDGQIAVSAGFGEPGDVDVDLADRIKQTKYFTLNADGSEKPLDVKLDAEKGTYTASVPNGDVVAIMGACDYGLFGRGDNPPAMLRYFAKTLTRGPRSWAKARGSKNLSIEVTPTLKGKEIVLLVEAKGKPLAEAPVTVFGPKTEKVKLTTNASGEAVFPNEGPGTYNLYARNQFDEQGEVDGKKYSRATEYATLTFSLHERREGDRPTSTPGSNRKAAEGASQFPPLPEAVTSFGGAVAGDWLYVYSGHIGGTHQHSMENLSKGFYRLNLKAPKEWEKLPAGPALQGLPLVAHNGKLYRVGGFTAKNATTKEKDDLHSVADVARFDPAKGAWETLPSLPSARSSHDAVVIGDKLYVVGGWKLEGRDKDSEWHTKSLVMDLSKDKLAWEELPEQPFERRALTVGEHHGKLIVAGGMDSDNSIALDVDIFDPQTGKWSSGPVLPTSSNKRGMGGMRNINGFGASAWALNGDLYVSPFSGDIYRLSKDMSKWESVATLAVPRFFHRLLPLGKNKLIVVGGSATGGGHLKLIETVTIGAGKQVASWTLPVSSKAHHGQGLFYHRGALHLFGGNNSAGPHDFAAENFVDQAIKVDVASLSATELAKFPTSRQGMETAVIEADRRAKKPAIGYAVGGLYSADGKVRSSDEVYSYDFAKNEWTLLPVKLPHPRAMFGMVERDKKLWIFGGAEVGESPNSELPLDIITWDTTSDAKSFETTSFQLPRGRRSFGHALLDDRFYLIGGIAGRAGLVAECDVFNFATNSWETIPAPAKARVFPQVAVMDGKLYVAGGFSASEEAHMAPNNTIEVYDPQTKKWTTSKETIPQVGAGARMFANGQRLLFCGLDHKAGKFTATFVQP